MVIVKKEVELH